MNISSKSESVFTEKVSLASALTLNEREELLMLMQTSYPHWTLADVFENDLLLHQRYILRIYINDFLVASRQVVVVSMSEKIPAWIRAIGVEMSVNHLAVGSRAIVHPLFRGQNLGSSPVNKLNQEVFNHFKVEMILGSSTSISAISLYQRLGAEVWKDDRVYLEKQKVLLSGKEKNTRMLLPVHYYYWNPANKIRPELFMSSIPCNPGIFEVENFSQ